MAVFNFFSVLSMIAPPFLALFAWKKFLRVPDRAERPRWKTVVEWTSLLAISALFVVCLIAVLTIPCNVDRFGWGCVATWRSFSAAVVRSTPAFLLLACIGRKGTRILSILWVLAINFDCLTVDLLA